MAEVATLSVKLEARDKLSAPLGKMQKKMESFAGAARKMGMAMTAVGGAITAAAALSVKNFATMGDEIQKMALRTGFGTQALSEMGFALKIAGSDIKGFEAGIKRMASFVLDAKDGLSTSTDALDRLGVSVQDLEGLSPEKAFEVLSNAISRVPDQLEKSALAQDVFGRAGTRLLPLLNEGAKGIAALRDEARELGVTFSQEAANSAAELNDSMFRLKSSVEGLSLTVGSTLAPLIEAMAKRLTIVTQKLREWTQAHPQLTKFLVIAATAIGGLMLVVGPLLLLLPTMAAAIGILSVAFGTLSLSMLPVTLAVVGIAAAITALTILILKNQDTLLEWVAKGARAYASFSRLIGGDQLASQLETVAIKMESMARESRKAAVDAKGLADALDIVPDKIDAAGGAATEATNNFVKLRDAMQSLSAIEVATGGAEIGGADSVLLAKLQQDQATLKYNEEFRAAKNAAAKASADEELAIWTKFYQERFATKDAMAKKEVDIDSAAWAASLKIFRDTQDEAAATAEAIIAAANKQSEARLAAMKRVDAGVANTIQGWQDQISVAGKLGLTVNKVGLSFLESGGSVEKLRQALTEVTESGGGITAFLALLSLSAEEAKAMVDGLNTSLNKLGKEVKGAPERREFEDRKKNALARIGRLREHRSGLLALTDKGSESSRQANLAAANETTRVIAMILKQLQQGDNALRLQGLHGGGTVQGRRGVETTIRAMPGEVMLTEAQARGGVGTKVLNVIVNYHAPSYESRDSVAQIWRDVANDGGFQEFIK